MEKLFFDIPIEELQRIEAKLQSYEAFKGAEVSIVQLIILFKLEQLHIHVSELEKQMRPPAINNKKHE